jgi:hypothetical protein
MASAQIPVIVWILVLLSVASPQVYGGQQAQGVSQQNIDANTVQPQPSSSTPQQQNDEKVETGAQSASVVGTATDVNDDPIPGATVVLQDPTSANQRTFSTNENGFFEIHDLTPGIPYHVTVSATGFASWTSPTVILKPGQFNILTGSKLQVEGVQTSITVSANTNEEIATQQVNVEVTQRGLGIIPNFFAVYSPNPEPLTAKLKFKLSTKVAIDPFTVVGSAFIAGVNHATDSPNFAASGMKGFGERVGASYANNFTDIMFTGAILPSIFRQDPRYYYQGTGTKKSRVIHALSNIIIAKGDNGRWQPNYSSLGGDLTSAAIANTYYPGPNRGAGLVFQNFGIYTAGHASVRILEEFIFRPAR